MNEIQKTENTAEQWRLLYEAEKRKNETRVCSCRYSDADYERLRKALETISGPEDRGPWIDAYRAAGGGYAGLQAIARQALDPGVVVHGNDVVLEDGQRIPIQEFYR